MTLIVLTLVHCSLASTCTVTLLLLIASSQQAVQKLVEIEFGDEGQNGQINITTNFPCYIYGTVRAGN